MTVNLIKAKVIEMWPRLSELDKKIVIETLLDVMGEYKDFMYELILTEQTLSPQDLRDKVYAKATTCLRIIDESLLRVAMKNENQNQRTH